MKITMRPATKLPQIIIHTNSCGSQSYGLRHRSHGLSHGLKIARQLSFFTPVCALVPPFRVPPARSAK